MFKWILLVTLIFWWYGYYLANASYTDISKQIDLKTMQIKKPDYILKKSNSCVWSCKNYSTSGRYWWSSYWWK